MEPYYDDGQIQIWHADCRDVLPTLAAGSVDVVLTDPPYGVDFDYGPAFSDSATHVRAWASWFPRDWEMIAIPKTFTQLGRRFLPQATDYVLLWSLPDAQKTPASWQPSNARNWFKAETSIIRRGPERGHPCPRPLDAMRFLVSMLCPPGGVIIDPFAGSGSTLVAARQCGRCAVGIELSEEYCEIAVRRLQQSVLPLGDVA